MSDRSLIAFGRSPALGWSAAPVIPARFVNPGLSLAQIVAIVWAYRRLTGLIVAFVLATTAVLLVILPRSYTATSTLMVHYEVNDPINGRDLPVGQIGSYIATQVELMQTPGALRAVVERLQLTEDPDYARGFDRADGTLVEWVSAKLKKKLTITPSPQGSQLIYVSYSAASAAEAANVANAVAEVYRDQDRDRALGPPSERAARYARQLDDLKRNVDQAQAHVTAFRERNDVVDDVKADNDNARLAALETKLLEAQNVRRVAESRATQNIAVSDEVLASNQVQTLRGQIANEELHLAQLRQVDGPQHPDVIVAQAQIEDSRRALGSALQTYAANAASSLMNARRLETSLEQAVNEQRERVARQSRLRDDAGKYRLELASAQEAYKRALDGRDQVEFTIAVKPSSNVELVSPATPPVAASKPNVPAGIALGVVAALLLGLAGPLGFELFNRRVRCRDDLERQHGLPVLAEFRNVSKVVTQ